MALLPNSKVFCVLDFLSTVLCHLDFVAVFSGRM